MNHESSSLRRNCLTLWAFCVIFFWYQYGVASAIPSTLNEELQLCFSVGPKELGQILCFYYAFFVIMQIPAGILIDKFNVKTITMMAFLSMTVGSFLLLSGGGFFIGCLSQAIIGFAGSFAFVLLLRVTNDYFSREKTDLMVGIATALGCTGPILMGLLVAHFSEIYYWKNIIRCIGAFGFALFLILFLVVDKEKIAIPKKNNEKKDDPSYSLKTIFLDKQYILVGIFSMAVMGPINAFCNAWGLSFLKAFYGITKVEAASAIGTVFIGFVFGCPLVSWMSSKIQSYKKLMIAGSIAAMLMLTIIIFVKTNLTILNIMTFWLGVFGSCQILSFQHALCAAPKKFGASVSGLVNTITMLGGTILVPMVGAILEHANRTAEITEDIYAPEDFQKGLTVLLSSLMAAAITTFFIRDRYRKQTTTF